MSNVSDRLDAIQARLDAAAPGTITIMPSDVAWLREIARKQDAALSAVKEVSAQLSTATPTNSDNPAYASGRTSGFRIASVRINQALEAAK